VIHLRRMQTGDYFGELGLVAGERTAHVVARESLTCLVLSRTPIRPDAGRGPGSTSAVELPATAPAWACTVDVTGYLHRKLEALARHRTQYPIVPSMLPRRLLEQMLGTEFFRRAPDGAERG
jgi:CRP-like cAMP-binding protein